MDRVTLNHENTRAIARSDSGEGSSATARSGTIVSMDYTQLRNKPSIEGVELVGDRLFTDLGMSGSENVGFDHGVITVDELTAAQMAAILTDD